VALDVLIINAGATNSQKLTGTVSISSNGATTIGTGDLAAVSSVTTTIYATGAIDTTAAQTLDVTITHSLAAATISYISEGGAVQVLKK
jgi:hypothetical protein